jgi:NTP pyrophosphatase (non-canonical NTP hydrolase)
MNKVFAAQQAVRTMIIEKQNELPASNTGELCEQIKAMSFYLSQEVVELVEEIGGGRDINKPWKVNYTKLSQAPIIITDHIKSEAMDVLAFAMNICILAGITSENIEEEYFKVYYKNVKRVNDGY